MSPSTYKDDVRWLLLIIILVLVVTLVSCISVTSASSIDPMVIEQFVLAQAKVVEVYPDAGDPYSIKATSFIWESMNGLFACGMVAITDGCFHPPNLVRYRFNVEEAVLHEAGHAILFALDDEHWECSFDLHENEGCDYGGE